MPSLLISTTVPITIDAFLVPFARHFRELGWRVDALTGYGDVPLKAIDFDRVHQVRWSRNPLDPRNLIGVPGAIRAAVENGGYEVVHVHTPVAAFVTRYALRARATAGPKIVYTAHGFHFHEHGAPLRNRAFVGLERLGGRWTDRLIVLNDFDAAAVERHGIVPPDRLVRMPGIGLDLERFDPNAIPAPVASAARASLSLEAHRPYFLMVAEFNPGKRHADLLHAFASVVRTRPAAPPALVLAGRGRLLERTRELAAELGVLEHVRLPGYRDDIPALIRGAAAVALPSEREGLPRCLMEAMAMEVPAIGTSIRGTTDLLGGGAGLLVEVGDRAALADALRFVLDRPAEAKAMARTARERARAYDLQNVIRMHADLYAELMSSPRQPAARAVA